MSDITVLDTTDPNELADEINKFVGAYARRTGNYEMAGTLSAAAEWLVHQDETVQTQNERIAKLEDSVSWLEMETKAAVRPVIQSLQSLLGSIDETKEPA